MSTARLATLLALLAISASTLAISTHMWNYTLSDVTANHLYPQGSREYHCFDVDGSTKTYVRGTYGNFGYFEGAVSANDPHTFNVNWYEVTAGTMTPNSGAAVLTYSSNWEHVSGPYWNSGSSDILNSYGSWNSTHGFANADDTTAAGQGILQQNCLYAGAAATAARSNVQSLVNVQDGAQMAISGESDEGQNTLCQMPAGTPGGSWLGTYKYVYPDDDGVEEGTYSVDPFGFWVSNGFGFVGNWKANSGPYEGSTGSNIYMVIKQDSDTLIVGFYCNIDGTDDSSLYRTACFNEYYEVSNTNNVGDCPYYYRGDRSLDPLYVFASTGSAISDGEYSHKEALSTKMAILFGILSGIFLAVIVYLAIRLAEVEKRQQQQTGAQIQMK